MNTFATMIDANMMGFDVINDDHEQGRVQADVEDIQRLIPFALMEPSDARVWIKQGDIES